VRLARIRRSTQNALNTQSRSFSAGSALFALMVVMICSGCGKKGPPLPPLLHLPAAPADVAATRRGDQVVVELTVPSANTDNTRPANVEQVDVYGITASGEVTDDQLVKRGTKLGQIAVKAPRDPNDTAEPDESDADVEPPVGNGLDQGARATVEEQLAAAALVPVDVGASDTKRKQVEVWADGPLLGPPTRVLTRTYAGVGVNTHGKRGPVSRRVSVPLVAPPPAPAPPTIAYDEHALTLTWSAAPVESGVGLLPSYPLGASAPVLTYQVYEVRKAPAPEVPLTKAPIAETTFTDQGVTFGAERCFAVRTVATIGPLSVESGEAPPKCVTLKDTFPPAAPKGLSGVASEGTISLIWDANSEKDLAGYLVLRGEAPDGAMTAITPAPIEATNFNDRVPAGVRYVYAIVAVDTAGNRSAPSNRFEEAAR
jgi:predicted small lipoprotein YifL